MKTSLDIVSLKAKALQFRKDILIMLNGAKSGHPGGSLSSVELMISLYEYQLKHNPKNPRWDGRDRLIISKGHVSPVVYVTLAHYGYFPQEELKTFRKFGARLQGHVSVGVPGVEFNTGSLGHGLSFSNGLALGARMKNKGMKVYCLMGDGEIQEGSVWEAAMSSAHLKLDNVCAIVDYNKVQENGQTNDIMNIEPLADKWRSFGWNTVECDGHDFEDIQRAFGQFGAPRGKPTVLLAHTVKGKGISFMENTSKWHGKAPDNEQLKTALAELEGGAK